MKFTKISSILILAVALTITGCAKNDTSKQTDTDTTANSEEVVASSDEDTNSGSDSSIESETYPIVIQHAFGETVIEKKPERIATISWGNQDVPLALGVIPVGVSEANYGVTDNSGLLPWTLQKFQELNVDAPVLFNDTDGLNYEAINDVKPDIILAAYSGITQEEYNLLSEIAPVVAYPTLAWQTYWRDMILMDANGMGMKAEGQALVKELEELLEDRTSVYPQIKDKSAAFFYFNPSDLGKFYVYLPTDPRAAYLTDLGMKIPDSVMDMAEESDSFALEISAENVDLLDDVDIIIAYGDEALLEQLQKDPLVGTIPAVSRASIVLIKDGTPLAASGTPSPLSIPATIDEYLRLIGEAADKMQ